MERLSDERLKLLSEDESKIEYQQYDRQAMAREVLDWRAMEGLTFVIGEPIEISADLPGEISQIHTTKDLQEIKERLVELEKERDVLREQAAAAEQELAVARKVVEAFRNYPEYAEFQCPDEGEYSCGHEPCVELRTYDKVVKRE